MAVIEGMKAIGYKIIDCQTKRQVGYAKTRAGATRSVDRRDNEYGAYRYKAEPDYPTPTGTYYQMGSI